MKKRNYLLTAVRVALIIVIVVCLAAIVARQANKRGSEEEFAEMAELFEESLEETTAEAEEAEMVVQYEVPSYLAELMEDNPAVVGWLDCDLLSSGYPIMWDADDNEYYGHRDINGDYTVAGSIYLDSNHNINTSGLHMVYGHRMKNGTMFRPMADMVDPEVKAAHPYMTIYTDEKKMTLEVIAAYAGKPDGSYRSIIENAPDVLSQFLFEKTGVEEDVENLFVMCTCSYGADGKQDERTYVIYREISDDDVQ